MCGADRSPVSESGTEFSLTILETRLSILVQPMLNFLWRIRILMTFLFLHRALRERCACIQAWMHLGSLENTREARVALGYLLEHSYVRVFRALPGVSIT